MGQKEFFVNAIELVDVQGSTNIPTVLLYRQGKPPHIGSEALSRAQDRDDLNEDFKVDLGNQKPGSAGVRRFRCADGVERPASELTASFLRETSAQVSQWLGQREIKKGTNVLVAEPLAMQEGFVSEGWLANYRNYIRRILEGKEFQNVDFLPEPFAVYQYYRYGEKHPLVAEQRKHNALVMDFGGGTFDVCIIATTKEGNISQGGRLAKPLSASSDPVGGFFVNRVIAEELIRKILAAKKISSKIDKGLELYRRWRREGIDLPSLSADYQNFIRSYHSLAYRLEGAKLAICRSVQNWSLDAPLSLSVPVAAPDDPFASTPRAVNLQFSAAELRSAFVTKVWEARLRSIVQLALRRGKAELSGAPVTVVLLSGGSANIRWLIELLHRDFAAELAEAEILRLQDFQEVVAKGLAAECARRYYTGEGQGDFSAVTYNRLCLILDPDSTGYELKKFVPRDSGLPRSDIPGVLLPSASVLTKFKGHPMRWKVHLDTAPRNHLNYYFLPSSFDPEDIQNIQNVEEKVLHPPKNFKFDPDLTVELSVAEDSTAVPQFIYRLGRHNEDSVAQQGRPFFLDMTTSEVVPVGTAYIGLDFGTSNTCVSFVNQAFIQVFERRSQERSWNELSDLASALPYPLAAPLAHYLCQTDPVRLSTAARDFIESALTLAAFSAYQEYCTEKSRAETRIFKRLRRRSAGPLWGLFKECMEQLGPKAVFSAAYRQLIDSDLNKEIERSVDVIAQYKHGKVSDQIANPLRAVQILANVTHLAFGENAFGMFQHIEKQRFSTRYEGTFRLAHGRPPFLEIAPYSGAMPFSNNEPYIFNVKNRCALPMEPLILWEHCPQHPDLENGHCFLFDTVEADGSFSYKAVGYTCVLSVSAEGQYAGLAGRLASICEMDSALAPVTV